MTGKTNLIKKAITRVKTEHSLVTEEHEAFTRFREAVCRTSPSNQDGSSAPSERLVNSYKNTVMATEDFARSYDESLYESLEKEFSSSIADVLVRRQPFTQRHKRKTLQLTTEAIGRRTDFIGVLEAELESLEEAVTKLSKLQSKVDNLPACSPRSLCIDELERTWSAYSDIEDRCQTVLKNRQQRIRTAQQNLATDSEGHALNAYLYYELETKYPVLVAFSRLYSELPTTEALTSSPDTRTDSQMG